MVSRKKILSKSRDDINLLGNAPPDDSEDVWYQKEKLFRDHIQEVLEKWNQIDDEIWAKVIVLERNRRVAKAYARAPVLTINGSNSGFDGFRIGLSGFENPLRDKRTEECRRQIGHGVKIKMDENGNILIKRLSRSNVFIKHTTLDEESAISTEILKLPHGALEANKAFTLFDINKFQSNVSQELKRAYPNRRRLENQCLSAITFVKHESDLLKSPIWMLVINMVAIDMLKSQIPLDAITKIKTRAPLPAPVTDEENYSVCGNSKAVQTCSSQSLIENQRSSSQNLIENQRSSSQNLIENKRGSVSNISGNDSNYSSSQKERMDKPPKLPPRSKMDPCNVPEDDKDKSLKSSTKLTSINPLETKPQSAFSIPSSEEASPDYDEEEPKKVASSIKRIPSKKHKSKHDKKNKNKPDDPYYCGLRARIPNFVAKLTGKALPSHKPQVVIKHHQPNCKQYQAAQNHQQQIYGYHQHPYQPTVMEQHVRRVSQVKHPHMLAQQQAMWHARSLDSGLDTAASSQTPYNNYTMFYRFQAQPSRGYIPVPPGTVYIGEWD